MKYHAYGALLQYEDPANAGTFINVSEIKDISGPGESLDMVDSTTHTSPNATREFLPGLLDPGEVSFSIAYDPEDTTGQAFLKDSLRNRTERTFRIVSKTTNNAFRKFKGFVMQFEPKDPVEGIIEADFAIKVTGQVTEGTV